MYLDGGISDGTNSLSRPPIICLHPFPKIFSLARKQSQESTRETKEMETSANWVLIKVV